MYAVSWYWCVFLCIAYLAIISPGITRANASCVHDCDAARHCAQDLTRPLQPHSEKPAQRSLPHKPIALTFDDGPHPVLTPRVLDSLARHNARATFFVLGQHVARCRSIIERIHRESHQIGNHTWTHPWLDRCSAQKMSDELERTDNAIAQIIGTRPTVMRPPYGALSDMVQRRVGTALTMWTLDTRDWRDRNTERLVQRMIKEAKPFDIVLVHDIHKTTVDAIDAILQGLIELRFTFVTVDELKSIKLELQDQHAYH